MWKNAQKLAFLPKTGWSEISGHARDLHFAGGVLAESYQRVHSKSTKTIGIERLVVEIETEQVSASEDAKFDRFARFQTFAQTAINNCRRRQLLTHATASFKDAITQICIGALLSIFDVIFMLMNIP